MKTVLAGTYKDTPDGQEAERILRSCVHCGFCTATCPTYRLLGDELDGPRGRIYLIKSVFEGQTPGRATQVHLDRCLTCRACETTCPSGVEYGHLVDLGRREVEQLVQRPWHERIVRWLLCHVVPYPGRYATLWRWGQYLRRPFAPASEPGPGRSSITCNTSQGSGERQVLLLSGCAQSVCTPEVNAAATQVLGRLGVRAATAPGCCGALSLHLGAEDQALGFARANIDRWWPAVEAGAEALVSTASGCGVMIKDYGYLLRQDRHYAGRAERIAELLHDIAEYVAREPAEKLARLQPVVTRIAFQAPCSLQHGLRTQDLTETLLRQLGFDLQPVEDSHLCCGSAGTYSLLQRKLSQRLVAEKVQHLTASRPDAIATANVGCQMHLQQRVSVPVRHWVELLTWPAADAPIREGAPEVVGDG